MSTLSLSPRPEGRLKVSSGRRSLYRPLARVILSKVSCALLDQLCWSGTFTFVSILLARRLSLTGFGAYALALSSYLIVGGFHNALVLEPMAVLLPSSYSEAPLWYLRRTVAATAGLSCLLAAILALIGWIWPDAAVRAAHYAMAGSVPWLFLGMLIRRWFYATFRPVLALATSLFFAVGTICALYAGLMAGLGGAGCGIGALGVGGAAAFAFGSVYSATYGSSDPLRGAFSPANSAGLWRDHWIYGRWVLVSAALNPCILQGQILIAGAIVSSEGPAVLRAMLNIVGPFNQILTSCVLLALPMLAKSIGTDGMPATVRRAMFLGLALVAAGGAQEIVLILFHAPITWALYGQKFGPYSAFLILIGMIPVLTAIASTCAQLLRAMRLPRLTVMAEAITVVVSVPVTALLAVRHGLAGVIEGILVAHLTWAMCLFTITRAATGRSRTAPDLPILQTTPGDPLQ